MLGLGIGIGIPTDKRGGVYAPYSIVTSFERRVLADGGTFESGFCLYLSLTGDYNESIYFSFVDRVMFDGGTLEARGCLRTFLEI